MMWGWMEKVDVGLADVRTGGQSMEVRCGRESIII